MLKILITLLGVEYFFANGITNLVVKKTRLAIPSEIKEAIVDRVHRLRLDTQLLIQFLWLLTVFVGFPLQFKIWDLQVQLWLERFLNPLFNFLAFCQGFTEGTAFGILIATLLLWVLPNWFKNQKAKLYIFYLLYRCRAIAK
jgi:hypothetical protein